MKKTNEKWRREWKEREKTERGEKEG